MRRGRRKPELTPSNPTPKGVLIIMSGVLLSLLDNLRPETDTERAILDEWQKTSKDALGRSRNDAERGD